MAQNMTHCGKETEIPVRLRTAFIASKLFQLFLWLSGCHRSPSWSFTRKTHRLTISTFTRSGISEKGMASSFWGRRRQAGHIRWETPTYRQHVTATISTRGEDVMAVLWAGGKSDSSLLLNLLQSAAFILLLFAPFTLLAPFLILLDRLKYNFLHSL